MSPLSKLPVVKRGRGRPPLPPTEVRKPFTIRFSATERAVIEAAANRNGYSPCAWARMILIRAS